MAEQSAASKRVSGKTSTGTHVRAKVDGTGERRQVVSRATNRVKTARPVDTNKVLRR